MIRIYKSLEIPASLARKTSWIGEDVNARLKKDQHGKCYLCERRVITDFQVEHLKSRANNPEIAYQWSNLLWACSYCNQKKSDSFDDILNPMEYDIESSIFQKIDFPNSVAVFHVNGNETKECDLLIKLLDRIFNGTLEMRSRSVREQQMYDYAKSRITSFQEIVISWLRGRTEEARKAIIEELDIKSEFLGFKYWIIRSNPLLLSEFRNHIIWNKSKL